MTRDEFINGYMKRSGLPLEARTPDGFRVEGHIERIALPCSCGAEHCDGWAMISNDPQSVEHHLWQHAFVIETEYTDISDPETRARLIAKAEAATR